MLSGPSLAGLGMSWVTGVASELEVVGNSRQVVAVDGHEARRDASRRGCALS